MKPSRAYSAAIFLEAWCVTLCSPTASHTTRLEGASLCIRGQRREMIMKQDVFIVRPNKSRQKRTSFVFIKK